MQKGRKRDSQKWQKCERLILNGLTAVKGVAPPEQNQLSAVMAWVLIGHESYQKFLGAHEV